MLVRFCPKCFESIPDGQLKNDGTTCQACIDRTDDKDIRCMNSKDFQSFQDKYKCILTSQLYKNATPDRKGMIDQYLDILLEKTSFNIGTLHTLKDLKLPEDFSWQDQSGNPDDTHIFSSSLPTIVYRPSQYNGLATTVFTLFIVLSCCFFFVYFTTDGFTTALTLNGFGTPVIVGIALLLLLLNTLRKIFVIIKAKNNNVWIEIDSNELTIKTGKTINTANAVTIPRSDSVDISIESQGTIGSVSQIVLSSDGQESKIGYRIEFTKARELSNILTILTNLNIN